jgi:hypothetical protein
MGLLYLYLYCYDELTTVRVSPEQALFGRLSSLHAVTSSPPSIAVFNILSVVQFPGQDDEGDGILIDPNSIHSAICLTTRP